MWDKTRRGWVYLKGAARKSCYPHRILLRESSWLWRPQDPSEPACSRVFEGIAIEHPVTRIVRHIRAARPRRGKQFPRSKSFFSDDPLIPFILHMAITAAATFNSNLIKEQRQLQTLAQKHVFVGNSNRQRQARGIKGLQARIRRGFWAAAIAQEAFARALGDLESGQQIRGLALQKAQPR